VNRILIVLTHRTDDTQTTAFYFRQVLLQNSLLFVFNGEFILEFYANIHGCN
jgi:hypothetical protein